MLTQTPVPVNAAPRAGGWDAHPADGVLTIDAAAGNALLLTLDHKWQQEGYEAFLLQRSFDTLWNHAQRKGFRQAAAEKATVL